MFRGIISQTNKSILVRGFCTGGPAKSNAASIDSNLRLGDVCPDFSTETQKGNLNFYKYAGDNWSILFSHPASSSYTPVCTTELGRVAKLMPEFEKRKCKVLALSVDSVKDHTNWVKDINETQSCNVNYPIIADQDKKVAKLYGMMHPNTDSSFTVRSVYFIAPDKKLRAQITLPPSTGRNFDEILRILDSLQLSDKYKIATPVDWVDGQDVIIPPTVSDEKAKEMFPKGFKKIKPYLRTTPQPNK